MTTQSIDDVIGWENRQFGQLLSERTLLGKKALAIDHSALIIRLPCSSASNQILHDFFIDGFAGIAQLVEHDLAKVGVASSSLVSRSNID